MIRTDPARALATTAGTVIIALTAAAFWLSYAHLAEVALSHGLGDAEVRAWAWPACLDLFIVAGEVLWLRAALAHRVDLWAIGLTVVGSGGSIALNVAGVGSTADPLNYVVAAVPPTAALLAFGALMRQVHQALAGHAVDHATTVEVERVPDPFPVVPEVVRELARAVPEVVPAGVSMLPIVARTTAAAEPRQMVTQPVTVTPADLRRQARKLNRQVVTSTNRPVTIDRLREEFGLSRRDAAELRREVVGGERS